MACGSNGWLMPPGTLRACGDGWGGPHRNPAGIQPALLLGSIGGRRGSHKPRWCLGWRPLKTIPQSSARHHHLKSPGPPLLEKNATRLPLVAGSPQGFISHEVQGPNRAACLARHGVPQNGVVAQEEVAPEQRWHQAKGKLPSTGPRSRCSSRKAAETRPVSRSRARPKWQHGGERAQAANRGGPHRQQWQAS